MIPCSECSVGQMHKTKVAYFTWLGEQMITVPDFPAWVCDICGRREYDSQALDQLALMLCPRKDAAKTKKRQSLKKPSKTKRDGTQPTLSK